MDIEQALERIGRWHRTMAYLCILFAVITVFLWIGTIIDSGMEVHLPAVARFWASLTLTVLFGVSAVSIKKIYQFLTLIQK